MIMKKYRKKLIQFLKNRVGDHKWHMDLITIKAKLILIKC